MGIFKEKPYVDYTKSSKYFNSDYDKLQDQEVDNAKKFVSWVQSFSKKIIVAVAIMYFIIVLFTLIIIAIQTFMGSTPTLDSIFTEVNTTFRIVVAGYLVKAGVENSFKIAGNYKVGLKELMMDHVYPGMGAFIFMYALKLMGDKLFKKESLGGGDIKLMFLFGLVLGFPLAICTIFLATFIAFPIALVMLFISRDNIIPFGPFLSMSGIIILISGINFNDVITYLVK